jgi:hypothetical protein
MDTCPSCKGTGFYMWYNTKIVCDCEGHRKFSAEARLRNEEAKAKLNGLLAEDATL